MTTQPNPSSNNETSGGRPQLRLTTDETAGRGKAKLDRFEFLTMLRDSGYFGSLKETELRVLCTMVSRADKNGDSWSGIPLLMVDVEKSRRAVIDARKSLAKRKLIEAVGKGPNGATRYRLKFPTPPEGLADGTPPDGNQPEDQDRSEGVQTGAPSGGAGGAGGAGGTSGGGGCNHVHGGSATVCTGGVQLAAPHKHEREERKKSRQQARTARDDSPTPDLFNRPRDAAACQLLIRIGINPRSASGLVTAHRPTVEQIRTAIANAYARHYCFKRGEVKIDTGSVPAFVITAIRQGEFNADDRLIKIRERARRRYRAANARRYEARENAAQQQVKQTEAARRAAAVNKYNTMTDAEADTLWQNICTRHTGNMFADDLPNKPRDNGIRIQMSVAFLMTPGSNEEKA